MMYRAFPIVLILTAACGGPGPTDATSGTSTQPPVAPVQSSVDPIQCAETSCMPQITACVLDDGCYSIDRCVADCGDATCARSCSSQHAPLAVTKHREWVECFVTSCEGAWVRPVFTRGNVSTCVDHACFGRQAECRESGCKDIERLVSECWAAAEGGSVGTTGVASSCVEETIARYADQVEDSAEAIRQYRAYLGCAQTACGVGVF